MRFCLCPIFSKEISRTVSTWVGYISCLIRHVLSVCRTPMKTKYKAILLKDLLYPLNLWIIVRLGYLMVLLAYTLGSIQRSDWEELPVPISEVLERLVDLEKWHLIQEKKNEDLGKRLLEQENLNKAQGEIIQNMYSCDCTPKEMTPTYFSDERYFLPL